MELVGRIPVRAPSSIRRLIGAFGRQSEESFNSFVTVSSYNIGVGCATRESRFFVVFIAMARADQTRQLNSVIRHALYSCIYHEGDVSVAAYRELFHPRPIWLDVENHGNV